MEFPEHLHDHVEILLVLEGSIVVRVAEESRELKAGFNSQRSFNRAFAEIMGMAPMEYRKSVTDSCRVMSKTYEEKDYEKKPIVL